MLTVLLTSAAILWYFPVSHWHSVLQFAMLLALVMPATLLVYELTNPSWKSHEREGERREEFWDAAGEIAGSLLLGLIELACLALVLYGLVWFVKWAWYRANVPPVKV